MSFQDYCSQLTIDDDQKISINNTFVIHFTNRNGKTFPIDPSVAIKFIEFLDQSYDKCNAAWKSIPSRKPSYTQYEEKSYRAIFQSASIEEDLNAIYTLGGSQTRQLTVLLSKLISYLGDLKYEGIDTNTHFDQVSVRKALSAAPSKLKTLSDVSTTLKNISLEECFVRWMQSGNLAESSIKKYSKDTPSLIQKLVGSVDAGFHGLFSIADLNTLEALIGTLKSIPEWNESNASGNGMFSAGINKYGEFLQSLTRSTALPKPFLLLAGISGTGKTRFVREQASAHRGGDLSNYSLIPVRPDWHEPSDLLGYISRIGKDGARYVVTDLLRFVVKAWQDAKASATATELVCKPAAEMTPYWLCLDEMNLAPVEQYFADYLAVLETREWVDENYSCDTLLKAATIQQLDTEGQAELRQQLGLGAVHDDLWQYFIANGIPLPPNLIVAGTVNMDETTHGFSRKVIDRAFTIDFGVFYPNDFAEFFTEDKVTRPKTLGFPLLSKATKAELANMTTDAGGAKSIAFMGAINAVLKDSPFELAYRALNELLLAVVCFNPKDEAELYAVWDDFLMSKVLPRIDGDAEKLGLESDSSLLTRLRDEVVQQFSGKAETRPDLLREKIADDGVCMTAWRAEQKLKWMQTRLDANGFTTFWP